MGKVKKRPVSEKKQRKQKHQPAKPKKKHSWKASRDKKSTSVVPEPKVDVPAEGSSKAASSTLRSRMLDRLSIARFRSLNSEIDTHSPSGASNPLSSKSTFDHYHSGFSSASQLWKDQPLDLITTRIKELPKSSIIADLGCGTGQLAKNLGDYKVHSFDLHSVADHVTACDMRNLPLPDNSVNCVVFCLSLMGNDVTEFIMEARRILKESGRVIVCEAMSRLSGQSMRRFCGGMSDLGFKKHDCKEYKVFCILEFRKIHQKNCKKGAKVVLEPCVYKKR